MWDARDPEEREAVKGSRGLKERHVASLSEDSEETRGRPDTPASLDHEEIKVCEEPLLTQDIQA